MSGGKISRKMKTAHYQDLKIRFRILFFIELSRKCLVFEH